MRISALASLLLVLLCGCGGAPAKDHEIPRRLSELGELNFILVIVDTLRADFTTPYGSQADTTPELLAWSEQGVVFEQARAQSSWTKISMASLLTSLWPRSHGLRAAQDGLGDEAITLAETFRDSGYATYAVQANGWLDQSFGFHQGFDRYVFPKGGGHPRLGRASIWPHADRIREEAQRILETHDAQRPFFLYLHLMDVHEYAAPPEYKNFGHDNQGAYRAAISWVDDVMAKLRELLAATGQLDRSVIVFSSDHGETFGEHNVHGHARNVLTPVVSVPLVLRLPFRIEPIRIASQVRLLDIAPTLLELAGIAIPESFEGRSLVPLMTGEAAETDWVSYAALGEPLFPDASVQVAVNDGSWSYARNATPPEGDPTAFEARAEAPGAEFLFDRSVDPAENVNLIDHEPAHARRLRALLDAHLAGQSAGVLDQGIRIDPAIAERLRAMGYLR